MKRKPIKPVPVLLHWRDAVAGVGAIDDAPQPVPAMSCGLLIAEDAESVSIIQTQFEDGERHESLTVVKGMLYGITYLETKETIEFKVKVTRKKAKAKKRKRKK